jgi:hypothetical protein
MSEEYTFSAEITKEVSEHGVPYVEIRFTSKYEPVKISFRAYPKRVFVVVEDDTDNPFTGADLDDCFINPGVITEKTLREQFSPMDAFLNACKRVYGDYDHKDLWYEVKGDVAKWLKEWGGECMHLNVLTQRRMYAPETRYDPAEYEQRITCRDCGEELDSIPKVADYDVETVR